MITFSNSRMPEYAPVIARLDLPAMLNEVAIPNSSERNQPLVAFQRRASQLEQRFLKEAQDKFVDTWLVRRAVRLVTGPFLLPSSVYYGVERPSNEDKARSATMQHAMVEALLAGTLPNAPTGYPYAIHQYTRKANHIYLQGNGEKLNMERFWMGVLAEAAIIQTFLATGDYYVVMPTFDMVDPKKGYSQEVLEWDVEKGIDFILVHKLSGHALLVDAKGRVDADIVHIEKEGNVIPTNDFHNRTHALPKSLIDGLLTYDAKNAQRVTITIPTRKFTRGIADPLDSDYGQALRQFLTLPPQEVTRINNTLTA